LNTAMMAIGAKVLFIAKVIQLPTEWKPPGSQFPQAFKPPELMVPPNSPTNLFRESTLNKYHVKTAKVIGKKFEDYIDGICTAIGAGVMAFKATAFLQGVQVMSLSAIGMPGCLKSAPIGPVIFGAAPKANEQEIKYSQAIANAFDKKWKEWQDQVMIPALPWYPAFVAFPGPMAPPMPNVPMPLAACPSAMITSLMAPSLKSEMIDQLGESDALHHEELFEALAMAFQSVFLMWLPTQMVMLAMGTGPIPTFVPPFVPAGPVIAGNILPTPGILLS